VQGADAAAKAKGLAKGDVQMKYWYSGVFQQNDEIKTKMAAGTPKAPRSSSPAAAAST
jgi:hypothetical protein